MGYPRRKETAHRAFVSVAAAMAMVLLADTAVQAARPSPVQAAAPSPATETAAAKAAVPAGPPTQRAATVGEPIRYAHDPAGQLSGVIDPQGDAAEYAYDGTGNITGIARRPSTQLSVLQVSPVRAAVGAKVTITGTGFATSAAGNVVEFGDAAATVTSASATQLVATVPNGAGTGPVTVTAGGSTATSSRPFTVDAERPPTITGFSPDGGPAGTVVTITGTGFGTDPSRAVVLFNGAARGRVTAATPTSLTVVAPAVGAGPIAVRTGGGTAVSDTDFAAPAGTIAATEVDSVTRLTVDGPARPATVATAEHVALLRFRAVNGQRLNLVLTGVTAGEPTVVTFFTAAGAELTTRQFNNDYYLSADGSIDLPIIPADGTYTAAVKLKTPGTVHVSVVEDLNGGTLTLGGPGNPVTMTRAGQRVRLSFAGVQGRPYSISVTGATGTGDSRLQVFWPDGQAVAAEGTLTGGNGVVGTGFLPADGVFQVVIDVPSLATPSFTVALDGPIDLGEITPTGPSVTVSSTTANRSFVLRFTAEAGGLYSLAFNPNTFSGYTSVSVGQGGGASAQRYSFMGWEDLDLRRTAAAGVYEVLIVPSAGATGSATITMAADVRAGEVTETGPAVTATVTRAGQNARLTFAATAGQRLSLTMFSPTFSSYGLAVYRPDGTLETSEYLTRGDEIDLPALTQTGTYEIVIDPANVATGSVAVMVSAEVDGGTLSPTGAGTALTLARAGQNARLRFTGVAGQRMSLGFTGSTLVAYYSVYVYRPDGTALASFRLSGAGNDADLPALPADGTYQVVVDPDPGRTGDLTATLTAEADAGSLSPTDAGTALIFVRPGQDARVRFAGAAGQRWSLGFTGSTLGAAYYVSVLKPDGTALVSNRQLSGTADLDLVALPADGTYAVLVDPAAARTGVLTATLAAEVDSGTIDVGGAARTVTVARAGQNARLQFAGTTGQMLSLTLSGSTLGGPCYVSVLRPDGTAHLSNRLVSATTTLLLPALTLPGVHQILINPDAARTGAITLALAATPAAPAALSEPYRPAGTTVRRAPTEPVAKPVRDPRPDNRPGSWPAPAVADRWTPDKGNLAGRNWGTRLPESAVPAADVRAADGVTALAGRVLAIDGHPLAGVSVRVGDVRVTTRTDGQFLLAPLPAGHREMVVEAGEHGRYEIGVEVAEGRTTPLTAPVWLTRLNRGAEVRFPSPTTRETVLTTPDIPGLEVRVPAGSVVRDAEGRVVRKLGITAIPTDRPPYPLPRHIRVPVYFTVQPGGAYLFPQGAQVVYPNYDDLPPGTRVEFWNYDPSGRGWHVYGHGRVTRDGRQVMPDENTRVYEFTGSMINAGLTGPLYGPNGEYWSAGDPVDLGTGLMVDTHTDLMVPDVIPISVTRTYRQADPYSRPFGLGQNHEYGIFLQSAHQYDEADLVLAHGGKVHYERISRGDDYTTAVFRNGTATGEWFGSTITWNGNGWNLTRRDGLTYIFGDQSPLQAIRDRHGNTVTITRDGYGNTHRGNITQVTSPHGKWIRFSYDSAGRVTRAEDNTGRAVLYTYDPAGRWLHTVTDPAGKVTTYGYDGNNRLDTITDPRGIVYLDNEYDANGRVARQTMPEGAVYEFAYTEAGGRIAEAQVTDANDHVRRVTFNADGYATTETIGLGTPAAQTKTMTREPGTNRVIRLTDQLGRQTRYGHDHNGNVTSVVLLDGTADAVTIGQVYGGPFDQITRVTDGLGHSTIYDYDTDGNLHKVTDALSRAIEFTYTPDGQIETVTDPQGRTTTHAYQLGDLAATTDPLGRVTRVLGDAAGRIVQSTDTSGAVAVTTYDERNLVRSFTDPLGRVTSYDYDENGNRTRRTDAREHTTRWEYDDADRLESMTDPLGRVETRTYDPNGNPKTTLSRNGKLTRYGYDELDRLTTVEYGATGTGAESTVTYGYDAGNRLRTTADSAAGTVTNTPDALDRITRQVTPQGTVDYTFDKAGRRRTMQVAGQAQTTYDYNDTDQLTTITQGSRTVVTGYDPAGRPRTVTLPNGTTQTYDYDDADQLTAITYTRGAATLGAIEYGYDAAGRRSSAGGAYARVAVPQAFSGAVYNVADQLTSLGGTTYTYDDDGNLTGDGTTTYTWNARQQLTGLTRTGLTATFQYDGTGRRTAKTLNGTTTRYLYDGDTAVQELGATGPTANVLTGGTDTYYARTDATGEHDMLTDALGSVVGLTGAGGATVTEYTYEPFGATTRTGAASDNPAQFTGRDNDGTGLYYYRARYYHPALQRFISEDAAGYAGGPNLYAYAENDPVDNVDPSGHLPFLLVLAGAFVVGALTDGAISYATQRLSGRKVDWGWHGVARDAVSGGVVNAATAGLGKVVTIADDVVDVARLCNLGPNSFTGDTRVLMADGSVKPISQVAVGDEVLAGDPQTGRTGARRVTDVIVGEGDKDLVDLTVGGAALTATAGHPIWDDGDRRWEQAAELEEGDRLRTPDGRDVTVDGARPGPGYLDVYNLTVDDLHTYYVLADDTPIFVHNAACGLPAGDKELRQQVAKVVNYYDKTGRTPPGVMRGKMRGYERGVYTNEYGRLPNRPLGYYTESDVWATGGVNRGIERLVFGRKGEVYYTTDHYVTFERLR